MFRGKHTPESLEKWVESFADGDPALAKRYALVVASFVGQRESAAGGPGYQPYIGSLSPATRRAYAFAITEFFEWIASHHRRIVPPHKVTRKDAEDYVHWLATRPYSLEAEKLRDGDQENRREIYEAVKAMGSCDLSSLAATLPERIRKAHALPNGAFDKEWLHRVLGRMTLHDLLVRTPTLDELRKDDKRIGISVFIVRIPDQEGVVEDVPLMDVFQYQLPRPRAVSRVTIALRLTALSSFWDALAQGENDSTDSILRFNIFRPLSRRVGLGLVAERKAVAARRGHLSPQLVDRLLRAVDGPSLAEKRDAALLWFLVLTGARVSELTSLRRGRPPATELQRWPGWLDARAEPPAIEIIRKGGKRQRLPFPPYAMRALNTFQGELAKHVPPPGSQSRDHLRPDYIPPTASAWRYKALAEEDDAPLFPSVSFWGANATHNYQEFKPNADMRPDYRRPMTRNGVDAVLKRIARKADFSEDEQKLVHGHAFRHFAATAMAKQGKPIREIQHILGHDSITTTEGYLAAETSPVALSGQNEILDYITTGIVREPPPPPEPEVPRQPPMRPAPPARPVIETVGVPVRPARAPARPAATPEGARQWPASVPRPQLPVSAGMPAQSPVVFDTPDVRLAKEGLIALAPGEMPPAQLSEIRGGMSPGSPFEAYRGIEPPVPGMKAGERTSKQDALHFTRVAPRGPRDKHLENLALPGDKRDLVQQDPWLRKHHYDPWPLNYGLGENYLLPWYARGAAANNGEVTVDIRDAKTGAKKIVLVPPLPVLSPVQMYPDVTGKRVMRLWQQIEALRVRWLRTSPTKAFGLDRWWGAFLKILEGLQRGTNAKFPWVPYEGLVKVGKEIRSHDDAYVLEWLTLNADRYMTTVRAFESIERPRGGRDDAEWLSFQDTWRTASVVGVSPAEELPDWFMSDDPVRDIYDTSHEEWEWFSKWIGAITGQHLTSDREEVLDAETAYAAEQTKVRIAQARELLKGYYELVRELRESRGDRAQHEDNKQTLKMMVERLADYGVPDPAELLKEGKLKRQQRHEASIEAMLSIAFPKAEADVVDANVLRSPLFDADTLRIDTRARTITHTPALRKQFAERYDGRDSECVARRAARGMWEHVKRHGIPTARGRERSSEYSLLYSVMLSYMAWIVPCPEEIERRMVSEGLTGEEAKMTWLTSFKQTAARMVRTTHDLDDAALQALAREEGLPDRKSAEEVQEAVLVQDSVRAEVPLPSQEIAERIAASAVRSGQIVVTPSGAVLRRRAATVTVRQRPAGEEEPLAPKPSPRREHVPEPIQDRPRRARVVEFAPAEQAEGTYLSVGPEPGESDELTPNAPPHRYLAPDAYALGVHYIANAESALPSAMRMMAAMTMRF